MAQKIYSITNLTGYADAIRDGAARSFTENYSEDLNDFITIDQIIEIIKSYSLGLDNNNCYTINEDTFDIIFDEVRECIYGSALAKLASKGIIECSWDESSNHMVFWIPDKDHTPVSSKPT